MKQYYLIIHFLSILFVMMSCSSFLNQKNYGIDCQKNIDASYDRDEILSTIVDSLNSITLEVYKCAGYIREFSEPMHCYTKGRPINFRVWDITILNDSTQYKEICTQFINNHSYLVYSFSTWTSGILLVLNNSQVKIYRLYNNYGEPINLKYILSELEKALPDSTYNDIVITNLRNHRDFKLKMVHPFLEFCH